MSYTEFETNALSDVFVPWANINTHTKMHENPLVFEFGQGLKIYLDLES